MNDNASENQLLTLRRQFHQFPEPAWCEFLTTSMIVDQLERIGVDDIILGEDMYAGERLAVPDGTEREMWRERAKEHGAREDILEATEGGYTGAITVLEQGDGPTVALRVDIDGLVIEEAASDDHNPARRDFRSANNGVMHACGHDAHITIGLSVLKAVKQSDFSGTFVVIFQPAEEKAGGALPISKTDQIAQINSLICVHIGLNHPTGEIVAGMQKPLAVSNLFTTIDGASSHAGLSPNNGNNAIQAATTAIQNVYAIPRHEAGATRVNVGRMEGGSARNVIADNVALEGEVRGETNDLMRYMRRKYERMFESAANMYDCDIKTELLGEAPRADSDEELAAVVEQAANETTGVVDIIEMADFGASEDATHLMKRVQEEGGFATYVIVGTDHPADHHTPRFDIDEDSLRIAVDTLSRSVRILGQEGSIRSDE